MHWSRDVSFVRCIQRMQPLLLLLVSTQIHLHFLYYTNYMQWT